MKKTVILLIMLAIIFSMPLTSFADFTLPENIKIGLFYSSTALSSCTIACDGDVIVYYDGAEVGRAPDLNIFTEDGIVKITSGETLVAECDNKELKFAATEGFISLNGKKYRGSLQIINLKNGKMTLINKVNMEEYLYSVLPYEMATGWPMEALKAQAVCARTYAATSMGRFSQHGFDLTDNTLSQMYGGVSGEKDDCTRAVDETRGMIVTYNGRPASVFYYASSSGETLDVKDVWGSSYPYLVSVSDEYQASVVKDNAKWTASFTVDEITQKMNNAGYDLGTITDIEINELSPQGAVTMLTVKGTKTSAVFQRERARTIFGFRSQVYTVVPQRDNSQTVCVLGADGKASLTGVTVLASNGKAFSDSVIIRGADDTKTFSFGGETKGFSFTGYGYGHGIGMSQNGAKGMANAGFTYDQILTHYFKGTDISAAGGTQE
ncbi:MAG: SpoIID/LytB domain-containing protein [Clostridia bacterium]|nr:SpoIID/LytB domain-containing protein [Clostridia bacterium]